MLFPGSTTRPHLVANRQSRITTSTTVRETGVGAPHSWTQTMNLLPTQLVRSFRGCLKRLTPVLRARVPRRPHRVIREDSSEVRGPGPNLLRRGRFAALAEDDTESVDNHEPDRCAEEVTQEGGCQGIPARRRRRLRIFWQEAVEVDERVTEMQTHPNRAGQP